MPVNMDLTGALRDPLPPGSVVTLRVESFEGPKRASTGTLMGSWTFIVIDPVEDPPRQLFENLMLEGKGMYRTALLLEAIGVPYGKATKDDPVLQGGFDDLLCIGREFRAQLSVEESEGYRPKNVIEKFMRAV